jgi:aspartate/methionine/tyrosine aminotransferase
VRKHVGLMPPAPVQAAAIVALADDEHVSVQRERYRSRRDRLAVALVAAGFRIDHSDAGLYLWATRGEDAWRTVAALADLGILVVPGSFYGTTSPEHVRVALTATDSQVDEAVVRLATLGDIL